MIPLSLAEIASIVDGAIHDGDGDLVVAGPAFLDSRAPVRSGLFLALAGEHADGHGFAAEAVDGGAAAVLGSRPTGVPTVVVEDVQQALQELARVVLVRLREVADALQVIAVTGSQGKTSAKDMLARVLADHAPTVATHGSFNNELGLPLTVLGADAATRHLVLEMGARGVGHLTALCRIAPPDVSVVLNVGKAHIGEFGSQDRIALAKGEIIEALPAEGTAVLNLDDPRVRAMRSRTVAHCLGFGRDEAADVRLGPVTLDELGRPSFVVSHAGRDERISLRLLGEHQAVNATAVAAAAIAAQVPLAGIAASLQGIERLSPWRMELRERSDGLIVVNDAYNANPDSMRAALQTLVEMGRRSGRATVAVLGEMRELGDQSAAEHRAVGALARDLGVGRLMVVGPGARPMHQADESSCFFETVEEAIEAVRNNVVGTEVVLVKASRAGGFERVAAALLEDDVREARP